MKAVAVLSETLHDGDNSAFFRAIFFAGNLDFWGETNSYFQCSKNAAK